MGNRAFSFKDAVVVVTGAGSGMGREISLIAAERGAKCALTDVNLDGLNETARLISEKFPEAKVMIDVCNVANRADVGRFKSNVEKTYGGSLHGLFNNAGIICAETFDATTFEEFDKVINVNQGGVFNCMKIFLPMLKNAAPRKCVVANTSSVAGLIGYPGNAAYGTSKWAVRGMTEGFKTECKLMPDLAHIQVTVIHPGAVKTPIFKNNEELCHDTKLGGTLGDVDDKYKLKTAADMQKLLEAGASTTPRQAALIITNGILNGKERILIGTDAKIMDFVSRLSPWLVHSKLGIVSSLGISFLWARFIGRKVGLVVTLILMYTCFLRKAK